jgi:hypothetical protein
VTLLSVGPVTIGSGQVVPEASAAGAAPSVVGAEPSAAGSEPEVLAA